MKPQSRGPQPSFGSDTQAPNTFLDSFCPRHKGWADQEGGSFTAGRARCTHSSEFALDAVLAWHVVWGRNRRASLAGLEFSAVLTMKAAHSHSS